MADTKKPYRRLPGTGYRRVVSSWVIFALFFVIGIFALLFRGRRIQLWESEEHLLLVEWDGNREFYKRYDYRDIQAFVLRKTIEGKVANIILAIIVILFGSFAIPVNEPGLRIFFLCVAAFFSLLLLFNALYGPTCECSLRTAVQVEPLPSLNRLWRARKVLNRIRPHITAAQGQLVPEEIPARIREMIQSQATSTMAGTVPTESPLVDPNVPPRIGS